MHEVILLLEMRDARCEMLEVCTRYYADISTASYCYEDIKSEPQQGISIIDVVI